MANSRGIDYSGRGATCNRDSETGIRYGIISALAMHEFFWESVESVYTARCPSCVGDLDDETLDALERDGKTLENDTCPHCGETHDEDDIYGEEPDENIIKPEDNDGISGFVDSVNDVWVTRSPFYTRGSFCSPCAPGAVSLCSPCDEGERAYCFPHSWYDDGVAPYPVYQVSDDVLVKPEGAEASEPSSQPDDGTHCPSCGMLHTQACIDGGRCIGCMTMLCALPFKPEGKETDG